MRLLILGGTKFLGRHLVDAALARGHAITLFTRGQLPQAWGDRVEHRIGDRDPSIGQGLSALASDEWDAVIDTSAYLPRIVQASLDALRGRVGQYLFVSTQSVYAHPSKADLDESAPLAVLDDTTSEDITRHYGALKAACEQTVLAAYPAAIVLRPGLIVGPHDATDRFGYWVARFLAPQLLGKRTEQVLVPAPEDRPLQLIDARDLASWAMTLLERGDRGVFNACSPARQLTMASLIAALQAAASVPQQPIWVDESCLATHQVGAWQELPLWIPSSDREFAGFMLFNTQKAQQHGLRCRPMAETIRDTEAWLLARNADNTWQQSLSAAREQMILSAALTQETVA